MWEIHKSGSVRGIETPHFKSNLIRSHIMSTRRNKSVVANKNFALIGEGGYVAPSMASKCAFS